MYLFGREWISLQCHDVEVVVFVVDRALAFIEIFNRKEREFSIMMIEGEVGLGVGNASVYFLKRSYLE